MTETKTGKRYSKVYAYKYGKMCNHFRYNFESHRLEYVFVPDEEMIEWTREDVNSKIKWLAEDAKNNLESFAETGYMVIDYECVSKDGWKDDKYYYMDRMSENMACEMAAEMPS